MSTLFIAIVILLSLLGLAISNIKFRNKLIFAFSICLLVILFLFLISINNQTFEIDEFIPFSKEVSKELYLFFSLTTFLVVSGTKKAIKNEKTKINKDETPDMFLWVFLPFIYFILFLVFLFKALVLTGLDVMLSFGISGFIGLPIAAAFKVIDGYKSGGKLINKKIIYFLSSFFLIIMSLIVSLKL